jgi:hypothetical protein
MGENDEEARAERARKLRAEIEELAKGDPKRRPRSPSEFIDQEMRERAKPADDEEDEDR